MQLLKTPGTALRSSFFGIERLSVEALQLVDLFNLTVGISQIKKNEKKSISKELKKPKIDKNFRKTAPVEITVAEIPVKFAHVKIAKE